MHKVLSPENTARETAQEIGLTERAVHRILRDLEREGYLLKERTGRRAVYRVSPQRVALLHLLEGDRDAKDLLRVLSREVHPRPVPQESLPGPKVGGPVEVANLPLNGQTGAAPVPADRATTVLAAGGTSPTSGGPADGQG